jgi:hypothetical protein
MMMAIQQKITPLEGQPEPERRRLAACRVGVEWDNLNC